MPDYFGNIAKRNAVHHESELCGQQRRRGRRRRRHLEICGAKDGIHVRDGRYEAIVIIDEAKRVGPRKR